MNIADTLWGFVRRWYIVVPGLILAVVVGIGTFAVVQPGYERTATQLLIPGEGTIPPDTTNPYLFLGGLLQASDIVVRVMQSDDVIGPAVEDHPGTEVVVRRDPTVSGPVIQIVVTAKSDAAAEEVLAALVDQTEVVVERLQEQQDVDLDDRMSVSQLTKDTQSVLQQKTRLILSAGAAMGLVVLTLIVASLVDGLSRRVRRGGRTGASGPVDGPSTEDAEGADAMERDAVDADAEPAEAAVVESEADTDLETEADTSRDDEDDFAGDDESADSEEVVLTRPRRAAPRRAAPRRAASRS
ncbi:hypothetical protein LG322_12090 [Microbacterium aerolatum]|uniref:hypothetical protein n=1 Tax=Microbacterium aerolatum TaxID=153731 RepID=UPI00384F4996